ncbi:unnamed protein product [Ixodes pacificus]
MVKSRCRSSNNCFPTKVECDDGCDPETQLLKQMLEK